MVPQLFFPSSPGVLSSSILVDTGMLNIIQWSHVPDGASGSSSISANVCVPSGMFSMFNSGLMSSPLHVYLSGMFPLFVNAVLVIFRPPICFSSFVHPVIMRIAIRISAVLDFMCCLCLWVFLSFADCKIYKPLNLIFLL